MAEKEDEILKLELMANNRQKQIDAIEDSCKKVTDRLESTMDELKKKQEELKVFSHQTDEYIRYDDDRHV